MNFDNKSILNDIRLIRYSFYRIVQPIKAVFLYLFIYVYISSFLRKDFIHFYINKQ